MQHAYLVRYGLMRHVGQFPADTDAYERGQTLVVQTRRGLELGEVLVRVPTATAFGTRPALTRVLRLAGPEDLEQARRAEGDRPRRLAACERWLQDGVWPLQLIDVEALLDDRRTVLHYLGPHRLDDAGLRQAFREACGLDVILEQVGRDEPDEVAEADQGCGSCGSGGSGGGCGEGGGCGSGSDSHAGGCSGCAVKDLVKARR